MRISDWSSDVCSSDLGEVISNNDCDRLVADVEYPYHHYPAVKIARLAVDQRVQKMGLGEGLVNLAVGQAKNIICPAVGCRFITVDSKKQSVDFYRRTEESRVVKECVSPCRFRWSPSH